MANFFYTHQGVVMFRDQTDYTTAAAVEAAPAASWEKLLVEPPSVSFSQSFEDFDLLSGQAGAEGDVVPGAQSGTITLKGPLRSQVSGYTASGGASLAASAPEWQLIADFFGGSAVSAYDATDVTAASTALVVKTTSGTYPPGSAVAFGDTDSTIDAINYVVSQATQDITMYSDMAAIPASGDNAYSMVTAYAASAQPTFRTIRWVGDQSAHDASFVGCCPQSLTITMNSKATPTWEAVFSFDRVVWNSNGGLTPVDAFLTVPPVMGVNGGRFVLGGTNADGVVDTTDPTCGAMDLSLTVECTTDAVDCHSASQGTSDMKITERRFRVAVSMPLTTADFASNATTYQGWFDAQTAKGIEVYCGKVAGRLFGFLMPAGKLVEPPSWATVGERKVGVGLVFGAKAYTADGSAVGAGDTVCRISCG